LTFTFPHSHGLVSLLLWGVLLGALLCWLDRHDRKRLFLVIAALVFSHFILDAVVYVPELPLLRANSRKIGLTGLLTALTWMQLFVTQAPSPSQLVRNWSLAPLVFGAIPYFFDRKRVAAAPDAA
jgi:hypothetical protein